MPAEERAAVSTPPPDALSPTRFDSAMVVNYYKILNVSPDATAAEIKSAYRRLAREMHPDLNGNSKDATRQFARLAKAYEILSNEQERAHFDRQFRKAKARAAAASGRKIHDTDSVIYSDNPHARRLRQMAIERRYNEIIDRMIDRDRKETLALQKVIFPTVALFVSTCFVAIFKPMFFSNSEAVGKIVLFALFVVGSVHLFNRLRSGFERYTYNTENLHDSIFEEAEEIEQKPYSRFAAAAFLVGGIAVSLVIGLVIGNYLQITIEAMMPKLFSPTLQPEFVFYPPIVVLLVDAMHSFAARMES